MARAPKTVETPGYDIGVTAKEILEGMPGTEVSDIIAKVKAFAEARGPFDMSDIDGREACASEAYKISRTKKAVEAALAKAVEKPKAMVKREQAIRIPLSKAFDELRDIVRMPLDEFEATERARVAGLDADLAEIEALPVFDTAEPAVDDIRARMDRLSVIKMRNEPWGEDHHDRAMAAIERADGLLNQLSQAAQFRAWQAEQARVEAERIAAEEAAREEEIAAERRRIADIEASEAAKRAEAERQVAERARIEQARVAEHERAITEIGRPVVDSGRPGVSSTAVRAMLEEFDARAVMAHDFEEFAERATLVASNAREALRVRIDELIAEEAEARKAQEAQIERAREQAAQAERDRAVEILSRAEAEAQARASDTENRRKIHQAMLRALMDEAELSSDQAKAIVRALSLGKIPHTSVAY